MLCNAFYVHITVYVVEVKMHRIDHLTQDALSLTLHAQMFILKVQ